MKRTALILAMLGFGMLAAPGLAQSVGDIKTVKDIRLKVGQSTVFYGFIGTCGSLPTPEQIKLPKLRTGTLSTGKAGDRRSRSCGKRTPAVQIIFTATAPGAERFKLFVDNFRVQVSN